jgi:hypothetical protein
MAWSKNLFGSRITSAFSRVCNSVMAFKISQNKTIRSTSSVRDLVSCLNTSDKQFSRVSIWVIPGYCETAGPWLSCAGWGVQQVSLTNCMISTVGWLIDRFNKLLKFWSSEDAVDELSNLLPSAEFCFRVLLSKWCNFIICSHPHAISVVISHDDSFAAI